MKVHSVWNDLRNEPCFIKLMKKIKTGDRLQLKLPENTSENTITIKSEINEFLTLDSSQIIYIEADGNYSKIVWLDKGEVHTKLLRIVIKKLKNQLILPHIIRCHRSFLINLKMPYTVKGNSRGYKLSSEYVDVEIPIARDKGKQVVNLIEQAI